MTRDRWPTFADFVDWHTGRRQAGAAHVFWLSEEWRTVGKSKGNQQAFIERRVGEFAQKLIDLIGGGDPDEVAALTRCLEHCWDNFKRDSAAEFPWASATEMPEMLAKHFDGSVELVAEYSREIAFFATRSDSLGLRAGRIRQLCDDWTRSALDGLRKSDNWEQLAARQRSGGKFQKEYERLLALLNATRVKVGSLRTEGGGGNIFQESEGFVFEYTAMSMDENDDEIWVDGRSEYFPTLDDLKESYKYFFFKPLGGPSFDPAEMDRVRNLFKMKSR
ncbi:hypothetical protein BH09VER1_BH09VER1_05620 [soil metagenome]